MFLRVGKFRLGYANRKESERRTQTYALKWRGTRVALFVSMPI
jgi:hypothetical protein